MFVPPFGELADPRIIGDLAAATESAGWDGFFLWDHVQYRDPATHVLDPWIAMAVAAVRTERVTIGPMVTPLARRRPAVVARQLTALDLLSGGRMVLGVGLGLDTSGRELSSFAEELDDRVRAAMLDESLDVVHALLSGDEVHHRGVHYTADGARFLPSPVQHPIPTWVAARWPNRAPIRRAARYEGVFVIDVAAPDDVAALGQVVAEQRGSEGPFEIVVDLDPGSDPAAWQAAGATWILTRFSQFDTELEHVRAIIEKGPPIGS